MGEGCGQWVGLRLGRTELRVWLERWPDAADAGLDWGLRYLGLSATSQNVSVRAAPAGSSREEASPRRSCSGRHGRGTVHARPFFQITGASHPSHPGLGAAHISPKELGHSLVKH